MHCAMSKGRKLFSLPLARHHNPWQTGNYRRLYSHTRSDLVPRLGGLEILPAKTSTKCIVVLPAQGRDGHSHALLKDTAGLTCPTLTLPTPLMVAECNLCLLPHDLVVTLDRGKDGKARWGLGCQGMG